MDNNLSDQLQEYKNKIIPRDIIESLLKGNNLDLINLLSKIASEGFVLHGSQMLLKILTPHKANCVNKSGCYSAVYATKIPPVAVFNSIVPKISNTKTAFTGHGNNLFFSASHELIHNLKAGYLYVLEEKFFKEESDNNFVCFDSIKPLFTIPTLVSDFPYKIKAIERKTLDLDEVESIIFKHHFFKGGFYGLNHVRNVVENAKIIAKDSCPGFFDDAIVGAYLHDIGRVDDSGGNSHALRGFEIAKQLLHRYWPHLDCKRILYAVKHHADGEVTNDPLIGTIWDSDRLDLGRVGAVINPDLLSTRKGKEMCIQKKK